MYVYTDPVQGAEARYLADLFLKVVKFLVKPLIRAFPHPALLKEQQEEGGQKAVEHANATSTLNAVLKEPDAPEVVKFFKSNNQVRWLL